MRIVSAETGRDAVDLLDKHHDIEIAENRWRLRAIKRWVPGGDKDDLAITRQKVNWLLLPK